jgi:CHAT domain-containing protein
MRLNCKSSSSIVGLAICLLGASITQTSAQTNQEVPTLSQNQPINATLKGGEFHRYKLRAEAGAFVRIVVIQQGVNVVLMAQDSSGNRLARVRDHYGRVGPQSLEFVAATSGDYFVRVGGVIDEQGGRYEITLLDTRTATNDDRLLVAANNHINAGRELIARPSTERNPVALREFEAALTLYKQINNLTGQAIAVEHIARIYEAQSFYQKALDTYTTALQLSRLAKHRRGEALALSSMGGMNVFLGNLDAALTLLEQSAQIHRETGNIQREALVYHETANIYVQRGEVAKGLEYFQRATKMYREVGTKSLLGYLLSNMGEAYRGMGDLKSAGDCQTEALKIFRERNLPHGTGTALMYLGAIRSDLGENRQAISYYQQAVSLCSGLDEKDCEARAYNFLGAAYASLGEIQSALESYQKSSEIFRQRGQVRSVIRMLNSSGSLYSSLGEKERARTFFNEALATSRKAESRLDEAAVLTNLAELDYEAGNLERAGQLYEQALRINREIKNRNGEAVTLNRLGLLAASARHFDQAIKLFEQALAIERELQIKPSEALTLNSLGTASADTGNSKGALAYFTQALTVFRETENKSGEALMLYRLARTQKQLGQIDDARRQMVTALALVETIRGKIAGADLRASYFATVQQFYDLYIELLMTAHRGNPNKQIHVQALQASEQARARSLLDLLQEAKADFRAGVDPKLLAREKELQELISGKTAQQEQAFSDPHKAELARTLGQELNSLTLEYETLQGKIREAEPRYAELANLRPWSVNEVQRLLDPETILLEYKLGEEHSYVWAVSNKTIESYELAPRSELERDARRFYEQSTERNRALPNETITQRRLRIQTADDSARELAQRLRLALLPAGIASVKGGRLVVVAEGMLQYVPFAALLNSPPADSKSVNGAATNEVVWLPSLASLAQLRREDSRQSRATKSVAVFADPVFESDDPRLPRAMRKPHESGSALAGSGFGGLSRLIASREEAQAIASLAPPGSSYVAVNFEANREQATNAMLNQYRVLHFATHALLNTEHPELSGIVLSFYDAQAKPRDGFLRLNHIYNLRLSNELVVLSACSTALGKDVKGEGMIGLTRGFMYAGVPRVIASLWKVDDEATAEFMKIFYRRLLREQMTASSALRAAQVEMQQQPRWRSPYYWAAFTLQGDWR